MLSDFSKENIRKDPLGVMANVNPMAANEGIVSVDTQKNSYLHCALI